MTALTAFSQTDSRNALTSNPVFQNKCARCHGKSATGRLFHGPSLVKTKVTASDPGKLREIITDGKGHMPKFAGKLSPDEINTLVNEIKAMHK